MKKSNSSQFQLSSDLLTLRSLIAVVEEGGFSAAAKRVHRTQSAISVQMAKLEDELDVKLLVRGNRSVTLTPAGETFLSYARRIIQLADEALLAVGSMHQATVLRVGFAEYLAPQHLHSLIARFRHSYPNCDLSLQLGSGAPLIDSLFNGELDIVFAGPEASDGQTLWEEQLVWTGKPELAADASKPLELVLMPFPCTYRQIVFDSLTKAGRSWNLSVEANSVEAVQAAVRAGIGLTILPKSAIREQMPLIEVGLPVLPKTSVMYYVPPNGSNPYTQCLVDYLLENVEDVKNSHLA